MIPAAPSLLYVLACIVPVLITRFPRPGRRRGLRSQQEQDCAVLQEPVIPSPSLLRHAQSYVSSVSASSRSSQSSSYTLYSQSFIPPGLSPPTSKSSLNLASDTALSHVEGTKPGHLLSYAEQAELIALLEHKLERKNDVIQENSFIALKDRLLLTNRIIKLERMVRELRDDGNVVDIIEVAREGEEDESDGRHSELEVDEKVLPIGDHPTDLADAVEQWREALPHHRSLHITTNICNTYDCCCPDDHGLKSPSPGIHVPLRHSRHFSTSSTEYSLLQLLTESPLAPP